MGLIWSIILSVLLSVQVAAQCCSAGNPLSGNGFESGTVKKQWQISSAFKYSLSDQFYYHDYAVDNPYIQKSNFSFQNVWMSYGISDKLSITAETGCFYNKSQYLIFPDGSYKLGTSGLGDLSLTVKYNILKKIKPATLVTIALGSKIPVGAFKQSTNGITIPVSLQPSSGAFKYTASVFFQRFSVNKKWGLASQAFLELSSEINKNYLIYRYGPYLRFNTGAMRQFSPKLSFSLFGVFDYRGIDTREFGENVPGSGSFSIYLQPWLQYAFRNDRVIFLSFEKPVYRYFLGEQLGNNFSSQFGVKASFPKSCDN